MKVNAINTQNSPNYGAKVKVDFRYKEMLAYSPLKAMTQKLEKSGTENVYELGKATFTNPQRTAGKHEVLLNGQKMDEVVQSPADGTFGLMKNFLQKCIDKENEIVAKINPEISEKLEKVRGFVKELGLSIENTKQWL